MRRHVPVVLALLFALAAPARAQTFSLKDLGSLMTGGRSSAAAINSKGQVVGGSQAGSGGQPYIWTAGQMKPVALPKTFSSALVVGANSLGDVVGWGQKSNTPAADQSLMWLAGGSGQTVVAVPGGYTSRAHGINDSRQIVGMMFVYGDGNHAFLSMVEGGKRRTFDLGRGVALAINKSGQIFIWNDSDKTAWLWTPDNLNGSTGSRILLGTFPNYRGGGSLNDQGQVVVEGYIWLPRPAWGLPAGLNSLGTLRPVVTTFDGVRASGINNSGQVVGYQQYNPSYDVDGKPTATELIPFIWDPIAGIREIPTDPVSSAGWGELWLTGNYFPAVAINDPAPGKEWGQIVYTRNNPDGLNRAALLTAQ